jgi:ribosome biogenesis GTPase / thiamine phosphate phosphatase
LEARLVSLVELETLGWNSFFEAGFQPFAKSGYSVGRVTEAHKNLYRVSSENGEIMAKMSGRMRHDNVAGGDFPAAGDWVAFASGQGDANATIHAILPRFGKFSRKVAGAATREQVLAANVDTAFLVTAVNNDFNIRRMERYLAVAWESGANPVIVLNKADLVSEDAIADKVAEAKTAAIDVPVYAVSALTGKGLQDIEACLAPGKTAVFLGSSGVGKSALINYLFGAQTQKTNTVREGDDRGRHTTVFQKLIILPDDRGMVIDTPGLRELQLWDGEEGLGSVFKDIELLAANCRFRDCSHENEPGCAVKEAVSAGALDSSRFESYRNLRQESAYTANRKDYLEKKNELQKYISRVNKKTRH